MKIISPMPPLRQRMLEDMQIRNYSPHTIDGYLRYVATTMIKLFSVTQMLFFSTVF